eukprot:TRINITY_DN6286_c0_g2_i1.p1 TRINITY_DN6286_c0_g2~~TRINITY_DN6286_c0_g2_i1.p1  ORF type:complete len:147 (+),score=34.80 TRINITY_DN6286_c0_g2_i1:211-651(+)
MKKVLKEIDKKEFEELFTSEVTKEEGQTQEQDTSASSKPKVVSLLDTKRSNNISIMLSRFKEVSHEEIKNAIMSLNEYMLSVDNILALKQFSPTAEEIDSLRNYTGEKELLGVPEKFLLHMATVPKLESRLDCLLAKVTLNQKSLP